MTEPAAGDPLKPFPADRENTDRVGPAAGGERRYLERGVASPRCGRASRGCRPRAGQMPPANRSLSRCLGAAGELPLAAVGGSAGVALGENATICYNYVINLHRRGLMMLIKVECFYWLSGVTSFAQNGKGSSEGCSLKHY